MKIAYILPSLDNKGPIVFTKYLIEGIKDKVDDIKVFYFEDTGNPINIGVETQKISFFEALDFDCYDIVHSTMLKPDLYTFYHRKKIVGKRVSSLHNMIKEDLKYNYNKFVQYIYRIVWKIALWNNFPLVVSSLEMEKYYKKFLKRESLIKIIPYGITENEIGDIDSNDTEKLLKFQERYTVIGSVGLVIKRKGFDQLIRFLEKEKDYAVVIVGDGPEVENLNDLAHSLNVSDRFLLLGFRNYSYNYYKFFNIYALVSHSEGFGLAMLEAMSFGLPIVCSDLPIYKDYFDKEKIGLFELCNLDSLTKEILRIGNNLKFFSACSRELFENEFSADKMGDRHIKLYKSLNEINC